MRGNNYHAIDVIDRRADAAVEAIVITDKSRSVAHEREDLSLGQSTLCLLVSVAC